MQVDGPGHTELLGTGSTRDICRNVILDTQKIKVICLTYDSIFLLSTLTWKYKGVCAYIKII